MSDRFPNTMDEAVESARRYLARPASERAYDNAPVFTAEAALDLMERVQQLEKLLTPSRPQEGSTE